MAAWRWDSAKAASLEKLETSARQTGLAHPDYATRGAFKIEGGNYSATGDPNQIQPGDLFELTAWVAPENSRLQVWMPPKSPLECATAAGSGRNGETPASGKREVDRRSVQIEHLIT